LEGSGKMEGQHRPHVSLINWKKVVRTYRLSGTAKGSGGLESIDFEQEREQKPFPGEEKRPQGTQKDERLRERSYREGVFV